MPTLSPEPIRLRLPSQVYENHLPALLARLADGDMGRPVVLDFAAVRYYIPAAVTAIIAKVRHWKDTGVSYRFENYRENPAFRYLQRVNFFQQLGLDLPEDFTRHDPGDAFLPVQEVSSAMHEADVSGLALQLARCLAAGDDVPDEDAVHLLKYSTGELILNCKQHSGSVGYVSAQFAPTRDMARIGIADSGVGILGSFRQQGSPHYRPGMDDRDGLELALRPLTSSTTHIRTAYGRSPNYGVGLSMLHQLAKQSLGYLFLASGTHWFLQDNNRPPRFGQLPEGKSFQGTVCSAAFMRGQIADHLRMIEQARIALGLQPAQDTPTDVDVDDLFQ